MGVCMSALRFIALSLFAIAVGGCGTAAIQDDRDDASARLAGAIDGIYRIGVDDMVQISVWRNPELSVTVPVRPDGRISVPLIGDVQAGGLTPMEVGNTVKEKLSAYIRDPNVAVILTQLRSHEFLSRVRVVGAVRNPRSITHRQGMTVLDAILEAGGVNDFAAPDRTKLHRKINAKPQVIGIKLGNILTQGTLETNLELQPGDVITVPERLF